MSNFFEPLGEGDLLYKPRTQQYLAAVKFTEDKKQKIETLATMFNESPKAVIYRAINKLYEDTMKEGEEVAKREILFITGGQSL